MHSQYDFPSAIQECLTANSYQESKCQKEIERWKECVRVMRDLAEGEAPTSPANTANHI